MVLGCAGWVYVSVQEEGLDGGGKGGQVLDSDCFPVEEEPKGFVVSVR